MRGGESTRVLELVLADGVPRFLAVISFKGNVQGILIMSNLR
jgi:hypothetical protein